MRKYTVKIGKTIHNIHAEDLFEAKEICDKKFGKGHRKKVKMVNR